MILNKLTFAPFSPIVSKQQSPTPRLFTQNKKLHRKVNQLQTLQYTEKQPLNFDDTFCFTELHKNIPTTTKKSKQFETKKCVSQILTIKHIYQNPCQRNNTQQNAALESSTFRGGDYVKPFELGNEGRWQRDNEKSKFCQSSHSSRRKYSMNKTSQDYNKSIPQRPLTQQKSYRKKLTFIKNKLPFTLQQFEKSFKSSSFKNYELGLATVQIEKEDELKQPVKPKKSNFFQYSMQTCLDSEQGQMRLNLWL